MTSLNEILSDFEQLETEVVQNARLIAAYYNQLRREMIPISLATQLTFKFAEQLWINNLELNAQHIYMHNDESDLIEGEE